MVNLRDLAETAAIVSWSGSLAPFSDAGDDPQEVEFWRYVQFLGHAWSKAAERTTDRLRDNDAATFFEELLVVDLLIRVLAIGDWSTARLDAVRTRLRRHDTLRTSLLASASLSATSSSQLLRLQRLQRRLERWADCLLGRSLARCQSAAILTGHESPASQNRTISSPAQLRSAGVAIDPFRCWQFAIDAHTAAAEHPAALSQALELASLRMAVPNQQAACEVRAGVYKAMAGFGLQFLSNDPRGRNDIQRSRLERRLDSWN